MQHLKRTEKENYMGASRKKYRLGRE